MAIFDSVTKRNKKILAEQERLNDGIASHLSQLSKLIDETAHFGAFVQNDFLTNLSTPDNALFTVEDLTQMKVEFGRLAPLIAVISAKVSAMGAVEDADPAVFAQNLQNHINNYPLDITEYAKRFKV